MKRIAIFASGSGSNFEAIAKASVWSDAYEVVLLFSDRPEAYALNRAEQLGIEAQVYEPSHYPDKRSYEADILALLIRHRVDLVVLAGYMRLVGETLLQPYQNRIINIHPSLLPLFPGLHAIENAIDVGASQTGVTIHYVDEGMDTGPIISQESIPIEPADTYDTLKEKIQKIEHRLYPETIEQMVRKDELFVKTSLTERI
ncbi:phosphoribosylglycinamide formyltransferase [Aquisalibacillus elongatus]|uniref:Phosphoribosylglycinamide formyltransferase n=1 Tax=Aquisalibacillus elongatus TaxID=485577 RepID=A0A3N5AYH3_9BACI|nr:phosphoribosylglycinamide formyltransferase [Aquisalibacillus elongatus]RPF50029.1 formyltetrahydrofolate-dependent phosphoribosylglycinamide formyltransferase [Aquisalibacillus elongatus]